MLVPGHSLHHSVFASSLCYVAIFAAFYAVWCGIMAQKISNDPEDNRLCAPYWKRAQLAFIFCLVLTVVNVWVIMP